MATDPTTLIIETLTKLGMGPNVAMTSEGLRLDSTPWVMATVEQSADGLKFTTLPIISVEQGNRLGLGRDGFVVDGEPATLQQLLDISFRPTGLFYG